MPSRSRPTIAVRGLAGELKALRQALGLSVRGVADRLGWPPSKLSRIETGRQGIRIEDVAALLVVYEVVGDERERLLAMSERSEPGWWEVLPGLPVESRTLIQLEAEATGVFNFEPLLVPGLLQTADYTRAVMQACGVNDEDAQSRVRARLGRQAILAREEPPELRVIIDEGALRRVLGGPWVMARQLRHLLDAADRPTVTVQVIPLAVGGYTGLDGPFAILDFRRNQSIVHLEHKISGLFLEEPEQVSYFRQEIDKLDAVASSPTESVKLIAQIVRTFDRE
ncbi:helix-turn-helix domain-containing protein [Micromonospora zhanjiangensis]|uniref:Helix-turn-helix domain-containing protein n=1 Tax=Micromonospora zhanjiangensis TaxID=1522057 RepID=A0ABV8KJP1_9ACTN